MEACAQYNLFTGGDTSDNRTCIGGGYIPDWVDRKLFNPKVIDTPPRNCFLKSDPAGIVPNEREKANTEVVVLCLEGKCNGAGS
jgi:hypothetical protein